MGEKVWCNIDIAWTPGKIIKHWYREESWAAGEEVPYQVQLDNGRKIYAPVDEDYCITSVAPADTAVYGDDKLVDLWGEIVDLWDAPPTSTPNESSATQTPEQQQCRGEEEHLEKLRKKCMKGCSCGQTSGQLMMWRKKQGRDTFTGCVQIDEPHTNTAWTAMGVRNVYKLTDINDTEGVKYLLSPDQFMAEMQQYD